MENAEAIVTRAGGQSHQVPASGRLEAGREVRTTGLNPAARQAGLSLCIILSCDDFSEFDSFSRNYCS
jgi:hypothetical protein